MNENNMQGSGQNMCGGKCGCGCGNGWHGGHHMKFVLLRWVLGILIITFVFWMGMKIGEFTGQFEGGYGMHGQRGMMIQYGGTPNMMYRTGAGGTGTTVTPAVPVQPTTR
jgi:hypothetical protein